jgi:iron complex outermembrane receptor protein
MAGLILMKPSFKKPGVVLAFSCLCIAAPAVFAQDAATATDTGNGGLTEIVVTAERRAQNMQDVPVAITAVTADTLSNANAFSLSDLSEVVPSFRTENYVLSTSFLNMFMRGEGVGDAAGIARDGGVGIYVDGFYISRPQGVLFDVGDVERLEVLRGVQGTLYGRNVVGGAINIVSKLPSGELDGRADFQGGNFGYNREFITVDTPMWHDVSAKITLIHSDNNGWTHNIASSDLPGAHDFDEASTTGGKFQLRWRPTDRFTADYSLTAGRDTTTSTFTLTQSTYGFPAPGALGTLIGTQYPGGQLGSAVGPFTYGAGGYSNTYRPFYNPESVTRFDDHALTLSFKVNDNLTLRSLSGYEHLNSAAYGTLGESFISEEFDSNNFYNDDEFTQEFQAIGSAFDDQVRYTAGLYYFKERTGRNIVSSVTNAFGTGFADIPGFGVANQVQQNQPESYFAKSYAGYAQVAYTPPILDSHLDVTGGIRYTKDIKNLTVSYLDYLYFGPHGVYAESNFNPGGPCTGLNAVCLPTSSTTPLSAVASSSNVSPTGTLQYHSSNDVSGYVKYAQGYKGGGIAESAGAQNFATESVFKPEIAVNYEAGLKSEWFDHKLRLNLAYYHVIYKDFQTDFNTSITNPNNVAIFNVGTLKNDGVEGDFSVAPIRDLVFSGTFGYGNSRTQANAPKGSIFDPAVSGIYNAVTNPTGSIYQAGSNISGLFRDTFFPKWYGSVNANWTFWRATDNDLSLYAAYVWQAKQYTIYNSGPEVQNGSFGEIPSYGLFDGRLIYTHLLANDKKLSFSIWGKNIADARYRTWVTSEPGGTTGLQSGHETMILSTYGLGTPRTLGGDVSVSF